MVGVICLAAGLQGYLLARGAHGGSARMLIAAALLLIKPGYITDAIGLGLLAVGASWRKDWRCAAAWRGAQLEASRDRRLRHGSRA